MANACHCGHTKDFHDPDVGDCTAVNCGCIEYRQKEETWTTFSVGLPPGVDQYRRQAEDRLARAFGIPNRNGTNKCRIYECLFTELATATDANARRAIAILRGEQK